MARIGIDPRQAMGVAERLQRCPEVQLEGLMTHFACADSGELASMQDQLAELDRVRQVFAEAGLRPELMHAANSAALLRSTDAQLSLVRPGISIFGVEPFAGAAEELRPVMRVRTEIIALRELSPGQTVGYGAKWQASRPSRIATVPIGYADGLSRALSNRGHALVGGRRAPIVGVVSMDMAMLDVTDHEGVRLGEECVVLGSQTGRFGEDHITALEIAQHCGSIPWEVLTSISRRVPRFYREP
jgi:alanine racemase